MMSEGCASASWSPRRGVSSGKYADAELPGAAVHAGGPGGSAAVLHGDGLDVLGGGLGPALDITGIFDEDGLVYAAFTYQWLTDGAEINGATASSYTLVAADAAKAIRVRVSFTDDAGNDEELSSVATTRS